MLGELYSILSNEKYMEEIIKSLNIFIESAEAYRGKIEKLRICLLFLLFIFNILKDYILKI